MGVNASPRALIPLLAALALYLWAPALSGADGIPATFVRALTGDLLVLRFALEGGPVEERTVFLYDISVPRPGIYCADGERTVAVQQQALAARDFLARRLEDAARLEVLDPRLGPRRMWFARVVVDGTDAGALLEAEGLGKRVGADERVSWCAE